MPDRSSHQGLPEEWNHGSHAARGPFSAPAEPDGYGNRTGSHRARPGDARGTGPTDAYGTAAADPFAMPADPRGPGPVDPFASRADSRGAGATDAFGIRADSFGAGTTDGSGARVDTYATGQADALRARPDAYGAGQADALGARPDAYGAGQADAPGARPTGAFGADPFGDADPFGERKADPFGPAGTAAFAAVPADAGTASPEAGRPAEQAPKDSADTWGFLGALFDFGFTSFVTPKVIKVLYMLIVIGTVVSALMVTIIAFKASTVFGVLMLVFGDPLFILIVLAIYRIILEFFVVTFRVAEDIRAIRERGDLG
jgi:Domain of unknown function (DUF4282)